MMTANRPKEGYNESRYVVVGSEQESHVGRKLTALRRITIRNTVNQPICVLSIKETISAEQHVGAIQVMPAEYILPHHFWLGHNISS